MEDPTTVTPGVRGEMMNESSEGSSDAAKSEWEKSLYTPTAANKQSPLQQQCQP